MQDQTSNAFTWKDLLYDCLTHWKWFVLSLGVSLSVAMYRIASTNETYQATASVLIKSEEKGNALRQAREAFNMMGMSGGGSNVHNEMLTLSSPTLMAEVIEKMHINETYTQKQGLKQVDLYKQEPVIVMFEDPGSLPKVLRMTIDIKGHSEFELSGIRVGKDEYPDAILCKAGTYTETPVGKVLVSPSTMFGDQSVGTTIHYTRVEPMLIADAYTAALKVELPDREASVIDLTLKDASPAKAIDLITTLIDTYSENWVISQNAKIKSLTEMVNERIDITLRELNDAEADISAFMSKTLVSDFDQASSAYFRQNLELSKQIMEYRTQVNIARSMLASLDDTEYLTLPANSLADNGIVSQIHEYNQLVLERNKLLQNTNPSNVVVSNMTKSIQAIREGIVKSLNGLISNTEMTVRSLEKQMNTSEKQLARTPIEARSLANVKREQKVKEELYLFLLEKREENDMSQSFASDNLQVIVTPHSTMLPVAPNKRLFILAALIAGMSMPVAVLLLLALFDTTVHTKRDLESLKASFLGEIPLSKSRKRWKFLPAWLQDVPWKRKKEESYQVLVRKNSRNIINESFRILRTKLDFMNKSGANKVFAVTSIQPGSGKTFVSMNLATSYAMKGSRVLVIDMDLRRATASKYVAGTNMSKGIADYLSETDGSIRDVIIPNAVTEGLDLIPVGTMPPNPAELILSERLTALVSQLREQYDYIFLDCPPIDIVAESAEIARYADMGLFVVRAGLFEKALLPEIDELNSKKVFRNLVVLLNGVVETGHYGKYGKYGYRSYYNEKE